MYKPFYFSNLPRRKVMMAGSHDEGAGDYEWMTRHLMIPARSIFHGALSDDEDIREVRDAYMVLADGHC